MKTSNSFIDRILPQFGNPRENIPVYSDSQKMFVSSHYTSDAGNMYFKGLRFTDRIVMVEKVGLYKNFTYIDSVEVYAFDNMEKVLVGKVDYDKVFYNVERIKEDTESIIKNYLKNSAQMANAMLDDSVATKHAKELMETMYENPLKSAMALNAIHRGLLTE